jgi:chromosome segregation protein
VHLRQRNRLAVLEAELGDTMADCTAAEECATAARTERQGGEAAVRSARGQLRDADAALTRARAVEADLSRRALTTETRLAAAAEILGKLEADFVETEAQAEETECELAALADPNSANARLGQAHAVAAEARRQESAAGAEVERLGHEALRRRERLSAIDVEERSWRKRAEDATAHRSALLVRQREIETELVDLTARPATIAAESGKLGRAIADAAAHSRRTADALALGETQLRQSTEGSRLAGQGLAEAREQLARVEVMRSGAAAAVARLAQEIRERLDAAPEALSELAGLAPVELAADATDTASRLERLMRERDGIGPVNLVAETEAADAEARIAALQQERAELTEAISRLRRGITALDQEMRRRLNAAFEQINTHFSALFIKLFGGGKAQLSLVDDEDPLMAGLEIMASPPGKRLQSLSLLSGGEQALTALALLFAAFLTNPAPVCVLDEVDAPLDDANVDRFCRLVGDIADTTATRFLIVTHHRITMARVDRLFGVTMAERGVSQLVSVDLARAVRLRQTA